MRRLKIKYNCINLIVLLLTMGIFILNYRNVGALFQGQDILHIVIIVGTVLSVHIIKASRLYFALYGTDIKLSTYMKMYCKVTPVSIIIPYKLGEFFRMYCYGKKLKSILKGIVIILLDRFMDTTALVTIILMVWMLKSERIASLVYIFGIFIVFLLLVYCVFPGVYRFWKRYLLVAKATENKLSSLRILDALNVVYQEITNVSRGRGIILFFLSLIAWAVEIGSLALLSGITDGGEIKETISVYLLSAMGMGNSIELKRFVFISVLLLIIMYTTIKGIEIIMKKRDPE